MKFFVAVFFLVLFVFEMCVFAVVLFVLVVFVMVAFLMVMIPSFRKNIFNYLQFNCIFDECLDFAYWWSSIGKGLRLHLTQKA